MLPRGEREQCSTRLCVLAPTLSLKRFPASPGGRRLKVSGEGDQGYDPSCMIERKFLVCCVVFGLVACGRGAGAPFAPVRVPAPPPPVRPTLPAPAPAARGWAAPPAPAGHAPADHGWADRR